ncbi:MAG: radical SAM protein [Streptosporangiales bacterium]|nr:radical SAM protein [Streptosporangiales bacterium]
MRWENLRLVESADPAPPLIERRAVARTFDTPEFRGITFYEIQARSIINRVPEASRVPFRWTINPYRGCSHACTYCLAGETPILTADGRTKPLAELRVGDAVYGTVRRGRYRRYAVTQVLAHWSTVKPAYRITLRDGTQLVASGDHRFLSNRGWKHVTGCDQGRLRRPHLTVGNSLMGTGGFAEQPKDSPDYRRGYLCGIIRGDGHVGAYTYDRPGRSCGDVYRFRLALVDAEALQRTRQYLMGLGIATTEFPFHPADPPRRAITAIRTSSRSSVEAIEDLIRWPEVASLEWCKGFLAGIFDAEGSYSRGIFRITNSAPEIIDVTVSCMQRLGFDVVVEEPGRGNGLRVIRLRGGLREQLRFFHSADPAIARRRDIADRAIKSDAQLEVASIEPLGIDLPLYDITTGTGDFIANGMVSHNCFARNTHTYLDLDSGQDFDSKIVVKTNAPELLRKELASPRWQGEHIAMGTNVDCYQRGEGRYQLMPGILKALRDHANPFSILTKGSLILRDLDLLREAAEVTEVGTNVSVGITDRDLWRVLEPGTPPPRRRLEVCHALNDAGLACGILMAPIVPYLTDAPEQLESTVKQIAGAGATHVSPIVLHLRPGAREWFMGWLGEHHPDLVPRYGELYGRGAYAPKAYQQQISDRVQEFARRYGVGRAHPGDTRRIGPPAAAPEPAPRPAQLTLL